jgi:hypothetical protein
MIGVSGWEADAALTWFTAFASLLAMIGLAVRMGGRSSAALAVVVLAGTASARTALEWIAPGATPALIEEASGFAGWLFQTSWAPQHVASAMCVLVSAVLMAETANRDGRWAPVSLGLVAAAAFQSSAWVGGVTFVVAAIAMGPYLLRSLDAKHRAPFLRRALAAAVVAVALSIPFLSDQMAMGTLRGGGSPVVVAPVAVIGADVPAEVRRLLDLPAYWLLYLPLEFPAFYLPGLIGLVVLTRNRTLPPDMARLIRLLALLMAASLVTAWLLRSVIGDNNDLGWRAALPAIMLLIAFAAAAMSRWPARPARVCTIIAAAGMLLAIPETFKIARENAIGRRLPSESEFAATPALWQAVRRHTAPGERIANNPLFLAEMTPWPVNISWALLGDRRSCYAGNELAIPFAPVPATERALTEARFVRVFAGDPADDDVRQLAERFRCDVAVVVAQDGAWRRDPFASSVLYRLVEAQPEAWRIYRRATRP